jgi:hypothetical protein
MGYIMFIVGPLLIFIKKRPFPYELSKNLSVEAIRLDWPEATAA